MTPLVFWAYLVSSLMMPVALLSILAVFFDRWFTFVPGWTRYVTLFLFVFVSIKSFGFGMALIAGGEFGISAEAWGAMFYAGLTLGVLGLFFYLTQYAYGNWNEAGHNGDAPKKGETEDG